MSVWSLTQVGLMLGQIRADDWGTQKFARFAEHPSAYINHQLLPTVRKPRASAEYQHLSKCVRVHEISTTILNANAL